MSKLVGTWDLESSENFDEYMKEIGVGFVTRKTANAIKPTLIITQNGNEWSLKLNSSFKNSETKFTENVEFEETTLDGRKVKSLIKLDGPDRLVHEQKDSSSGQLTSTIIREVVGDKLVQTLTAGKVECKRIFKKTD